MIRLFKHYVPYAVLFLALVDLCLLIAAAETAFEALADDVAPFVVINDNDATPARSFNFYQEYSQP